MNDPLSVLVVRGRTVEARHRVHAATLRGGEPAESAGDPRLVTFMRSSAKPLQAIPLAEAYPGLPERELAIACASHLASEEQLAAARALLERAGCTEDDLECGPEDGSRLRHNCSGKHAGFLAVCRARGWPTEGYRLPDHPLQQELRALVERAAGTRAELAVDGCGVPTFALPLEAMARAFTHVPDRIAAAMRAHPELIRGPLAADSVLMRETDGWYAKGGAEGLMCAAHPAGQALALKVEDGATRAVGPALHGVLARLGTEVPALATAPLENSRGELVGEIREP